MTLFNKNKNNDKKIDDITKLLLRPWSHKILVLGEFSATLKIWNDEFNEKVLITGINKCLLGTSFISKMVKFNWNAFLTNTPNKVCATTECKSIDHEVELSKLKEEYRNIFTNVPEAIKRGKKGM